MRLLTRLGYAIAVLGLLRCGGETDCHELRACGSPDAGDGDGATESGSDTGGAAGMAGAGGGGSAGMAGGAGSAGQAGQAGDGNAGRCNPTSDFGAPTLVSEVSSDMRNDNAILTADGLTLYLQRDVDLLSTTRASVEGAFGMPMVDPALAAPNDWVKTAQSYTLGSVAGDGLTMYFDWGGQGANSVYAASRGSAEAPFDTPERVPNVNVGIFKTVDPFTSLDGQRLYLSVDGEELFVARMGTSEFMAPEEIQGVNTDALEYRPVISADELTLYWATDRTDGGALGGGDIWVATRAGVDNDFSDAHPVAGLNSPEMDRPHWVSADGCEFFLSRWNPDNQTTDIYVARRPL